MTVQDHLIALTNAPSVESLWDLHTRKMAEYGFDRLLYGFTHFRTSNSLGDPDDFVILTNHEDTYRDTFIGEGLYFHAPMVRWALNNEGACSWSVMAKMIDSGTMTEEESKVIQFNREMGVTVGYSISFKAVSQRSKGAIALTARSGLSQDDVDRMWEKNGNDIIVMNNVAHLKLLTLPYTSILGRTLTLPTFQITDMMPFQTIFLYSF